MNKKILTFPFLVLLLAVSAHASLIDLGILELDSDLGNPDAELAYLIDNYGPDDLTYLQKWDTDGNGFDQDPGIGDYTFDPDGNVANMDITWDLTGTGFGLAYVLVKDGRVPMGGPFLYHLYGVDGDQVLDSMTPQPITIDDDKGISHVSFFGVEGLTGDGDFNHDGFWNCLDINALTSAIAGDSTDLSFDMNGDGVIDTNDLTDPGTGWLAVGGARNPDQTGGNAFIQGDGNLDGVVDVSDFNIYNNNKFTTNSAWCSGNYNADGVGVVDVSDFNIWNNNKFTSSMGGGSVVPEPVGGWVLLVLVSCLVPRLRTISRARTL